ncbi:UDP-N-acetylglucosamine 2-epimerase [Desulfospira joergensenii]|uniref:UDP-N-acetylglucosamine 2-epimerase n=1 Tax=Desulfospira joergensenii TaxID=53329 RepID=UPI0003B707A3|nr:UDP-N-acetylglucosamine 2-epimerase [Desulfospira joergensenii]
MRTVCVFTGTRAEYGLLKPLMEEIQKDPDLDLQLLVSAMHLSPEFGLTYKIIESDGFKIDEKVEMLLSSDTSIGIAKSMGLAMIGYCEALERLKPNIVVILGDRFESLAMAQACMISRVPISHLHGGEATYGVIDEPIRHSITKMSHIHFTSCDEYRRRVIQLGEHPSRVFNVGAIGIENIKRLPLMGKQELEEDIGFCFGGYGLLVCFHPVTLEDASAEKQFANLLAALHQFTSESSHPIKTIFTKSNADTDGRIINDLIDLYTDENPKNSISFKSLGQLRYLSAMKHAIAVVGNSSSGIIEAPSLLTPTINIGDRQKGRIQAKSVINCDPTPSSIQKALKKAISSEFRGALAGTTNPYEKEDTCRKIASRLKTTDLKHIVKKTFYDLN